MAPPARADLPAGTRCAVHPSRPALDRCPTCDRPRCAHDADGPRCASCGTGHGGPARALGPVEALVATAVVATVLGVVGAALGQEYVGAHVFSWLFPAIVGVVVAAAASALVGAPPPRTRHLVAVACAAYAAISALLDFRFTDVPFGPPGRWLLPVAAAVVAATVAAEVLVRSPAQERNSSSAIPPR